MKRTPLFLMASPILLFSTFQPVAAQEPDRAHSRRQADPGQGGDFERGDRPRRRRRGPDTAMDLIRKLPKLQASIREAFDLDFGQEDAIVELFEQETARLRQLHLESEGPDARSEDIDEAKALLTELAEAREAGDRERARQLRKDIGRVLKVQRNRRGPAVRIDRFLRDVRNELGDDQRSTFRDLVREAGIRQSRPRPGGQFQLMRRALFSPEVDLSQEQRQEIKELFRQLHAQGRRGPRGQAKGNARGYRGPRAGRPGPAGPQGRRPSPEQRAEQFKQFEESVLELLNEPQRERLATAMETLRDNPPERFDGRRWRQGRRDGRGDGWQEGRRGGRRDGWQEGRQDRRRGRRDREERD